MYVGNFTINKSQNIKSELMKSMVESSNSENLKSIMKDVQNELKEVFFILLIKS